MKQGRLSWRPQVAAGQDCKKTACHARIKARSRRARKPPNVALDTVEAYRRSVRSGTYASC
jgi:hypothetical protein